MWRRGSHCYEKVQSVVLLGYSRHATPAFADFDIPVNGAITDRNLPNEDPQTPLPYGPLMLEWRIKFKSLISGWKPCNFFKNPSKIEWVPSLLVKWRGRNIGKVLITLLILGFRFSNFSGWQKTLSEDWLRNFLKNPSKLYWVSNITFSKMKGSELCLQDLFETTSA